MKCSVICPGQNLALKSPDIHIHENFSPFNLQTNIHNPLYPLSSVRKHQNRLYIAIGK